MRNLLFFILFPLFTFLKAQTNIDFRSVLPYTDLLNDVWGYADSLGNEYALVGVRSGVSVVNVTNPDTIAELFFIPGPYSTWRDIKTRRKYAYITHDYSNDTSKGLLIIDLSNLPASIDTFYWTGDTLQYERAHNLYIDENGFAYLFGSNLYEGGALILDLSIPSIPAFVGAYSTNYVHDGFARGDTLWTAEVIKGQFSVIDVSNKTAPAVLATQTTPNNFTHNCWLSDDGHFLYTTDERPGAFITAYNVSDLSDIKEVDRYQSSPGTNVIPHNTHYYNGFLVTSYYRDGVTIVDANNTGNLVQTGSFDTSPLSSDEGFNGCWGAYPFLPSGNLLATDMEEGLFVLTPNYKRAAYLEGMITDSIGNFLSNINIEILGTGTSVKSAFTGIYKTGIADTGLFDIRFSNATCQTQIIKDVQFTAGQVTTLNISMKCSGSTTVISPNNHETNTIDLKIFPTIFSDEIHVEYHINKYTDQITSVSLLNIQGQIVTQKTIQNTQGQFIINGLNLNPGVYFVHLSSESIYQTHKIIKY